MTWLPYLLIFFLDLAVILQIYVISTLSTRITNLENDK